MLKNVRTSTSEWDGRVSPLLKTLQNIME